MASKRLRGEAHASIYERFLYSDLSDKAIRLLLILDRCANQGIAFPDRPWLAEKLGGVALKTVDRMVQELSEAGAITLGRVARSHGGRPLTTYYVWPATADQSDMGDALQSDMGVPFKVTSESPLSITRNEREPKREPLGADAPVLESADPLRKQAHVLAVLAYEQPVKPVTRGGFNAVLMRITSELQAGTTVNDVRAAIEAGDVTWTADGLRTAIGRVRSRRTTRRDAGVDHTIRAIREEHDG